MRKAQLIAQCQPTAHSPFVVAQPVSTLAEQPELQLLVLLELIALRVHFTMKEFVGVNQ
jgi:hypothetical protein